MQLSFHKYHGNGNDFIIIDNRKGVFPEQNEELIKKLCDRHFGIGGDGLMLLENKPGFDFRMRYYNSDGRESTMCGNGGRCLVHFARELGIIEKHAIFSGIDGSHEAHIKGETVRLRMNDVSGFKRDGRAYVIDTGSPHYVIFTRQVDLLDVPAAGKQIRYNESYREQGINVNFAEAVDELVKVRTYERGVENETLACGTGSVAVALCLAIEKDTGTGSVNILTRGGKLEVSFTRTGESAFSNIWLTGPARKVFSGWTGTDELG